MLQNIWGLPIVCYLFFGGLAGGLGFCASLTVIETGALVGKSVKRIAWTALCCIALGVLFLFFDLGNPIRVIGPRILFYPDSWISRGVWIIVAFAIALFVFILFISRRSSRLFMRLFRGYLGKRDILILIFAWILLVCSCALALYTGFLLGGSLGVPFWQSPFLPLLFLASSLGAGLALSMLVIWLNDKAHAAGVLRNLSIWSTVVMLVELALLVLLVTSSWLSSDSSVHQSAALLIIGDNSLAFWAIVIACGYVLPLAITVISAHTRYRGTVARLGFCECVLVGMFALRWCVVFSGVLVG
jgi:formate-dependent nitrite reductase membrane component NrfD